MLALVGRSKRSAVIVNACDLFPEEERRAKVQQEADALRGLGLEPDEIDLRRYFRQRDEVDLARALRGVGLVWVRGGNPFVLRRAMRASGFDSVLLNLLREDALVYGGYSAGCAVLTPSLHGIELVDDPHSVPPGYDPTVIWECLGVVPYFIAPHYRSDHPESEALEGTVQYFIDHHMPFIALRDGEAIVVSSDAQEVIA